MKPDVKRLLEELRLLGPGGVERAATAWRRAASGEDRDRERAERREEDDPEWREAEAEIFQVARGEAWQAVDPEVRESAVGAAQDALLALLDREKLGAEHYRHLAGPMAAALPWLLSGEAEDRY